MSFVADEVRRLDAQIDRISLAPLISAAGDQESDVDADDEAIEVGHDGQLGGAAIAALSSPRSTELLRIVKSLSATSASRPQLDSSQVQSLLRRSGLATVVESEDDAGLRNHYETEVEWLIVGKATVQTYGILLDTLLDQIVPLSDDIWYWDEVLSSYTNSSLYTVQTSPLRIWAWMQDIYRDTSQRIQRLRLPSMETLAAERRPAPTLSQRWQRYYSVVWESIADRSITDLQQRILSPVALCRTQARHKQAKLRKMRELTASSLGMLVDEALRFGTGDDGQEWKRDLEKSVALMNSILQDMLMLKESVPTFENKVFRAVAKDPDFSINAEDFDAPTRPGVLARRLYDLLSANIPGHVRATTVAAKEHGRPSRIIRYWLPAGILILSSSTILRILVGRKDDILSWINNFGQTVRDFWLNWVVEPVRKVIGTIRHDSNSEIAIMSRDSLKADRESLERMVVDFALDKPQLAVGASSLTETQVAEIRTKVREGDVTPVLKAYERDLRSPFAGAIRGDLVRSLLIQVQKTKVDLEVAISGIDALLKSQELVFGFVGLTPGILVSIAMLQYLRTVFGGRKGLRRRARAERSIRVLRNIDRILSEATPTDDNFLTYKDHGLLICEVHVLRKLVVGLLPSHIEKEFLEDLDDLAKLKGIQTQFRALERIRWAYLKWFQ